MSNALHPAHQFRNVVESKANDFLQAMVGTENGAAAAGRVALAFRQAAQTNDRLYSCEPASVAQAVALSAMTGLMPGGPLPDVYLLPRGRNLQWQVSHRGFAKLAARNGVRLRTKAVFKDDVFNVIEGTEHSLEHVPDLTAKQSWDALVAVYVVAHYPDGGKDFIVIRKADIDVNHDSLRTPGDQEKTMGHGNTCRFMRNGNRRGNFVCRKRTQRFNNRWKIRTGIGKEVINAVLFQSGQQ